MEFNRISFSISCTEALKSILRKYRVVLFIPRKNKDDGVFIKADVLGNIEQIEKLVLRLGDMKSREESYVYFLVYETDFTIEINLWDEFIKLCKDEDDYNTLIEKLVNHMCYILDERWYQLLRKKQEMFPAIKEDNWWNKTYREMLENNQWHKTYRETLENNSVATEINIKDYM